MHRLPKVIRPVFLNTRRMSTVNSSESSPVIKVSSTNVDQTAIKLSIQNFKDWRVKRDPPPDVHIVSFSNHKLNYYSYYPPVGFTPEEILQFPGAKRCLGTVEKVKHLIETMERDRIYKTRTGTVWKRKAGSNELFDTGLTWTR